jgi:hypothetical protein
VDAIVIDPIFMMKGGRGRKAGPPPVLLFESARHKPRVNGHVVMWLRVLGRSKVWPQLELKLVHPGLRVNLPNINLGRHLFGPLLHLADSLASVFNELNEKQPSFAKTRFMLFVAKVETQ